MNPGRTCVPGLSCCGPDYDRIKTGRKIFSNKIHGHKVKSLHVDWNDNSKRKKKEVIGLLDRVIEKVSA